MASASVSVQKKYNKHITNKLGKNIRIHVKQFFLYFAGNRRQSVPFRTYFQSQARLADFCKLYSLFTHETNVFVIYKYLVSFH
jgi:hypothetical protein